MTSILIIDDDTELTAMLSDYLRREGIHVDCAFDGENGLQKASIDDYDAMVLDVMLPGIDGFEVLRQIRSSSEIPVLMLTAKGDDVDRIVGLEIGADDYLPKPFNPRELLARIRAILRRTQHQQKTNTGKNSLNAGSLTLSPASRTATVNSTMLDLTSTEFNLLYTLLKNKGEVVSKETLSEKALDRKLERYDRSIDMHMSNLRKKLAEHNLDSMIITVRGQGYQVTGE